MLTRKQKTYSILDDEIHEDNVVVGHKSVTRSTDSNKKRFKKEIIEGQDDDDDDDDEVIRRSIDVFEQDDITTMALGTWGWGSSFQIWGFWRLGCLDRAVWVCQ